MEGNQTSRRRHTYTKVKDARKRPVRHLYRRNGAYYARLRVEDDQGRKKLAWVPLEVETVAQGQDEVRRLLVERADNTLRHIGAAPNLEDYYSKTYLPFLLSAGKKPGTVVTEKGHLQHWRRGLGHLRLDRIRPTHVLAVFGEMRGKLQPRTCNGALVARNSMLRAAKRDGYLKTLPTAGVDRYKAEQKKRGLITLDQIERICEKALTASKNGAQLADYIRFLAFSGAREKEALRVRWEDVDFDRGLLCIGAGGDTKNRSVRWVDMSPLLVELLRELHRRIAPDSKWVFPSPRRGSIDRQAESFRESRVLARQAAEMPGFGFHDCRHFFISHAVMAGVDFMTIAKWVGHRDGGLMIGKVYGHLSDSHTRRQAEKIKFA